jgi:two-component system LytT family response regulator
MKALTKTSLHPLGSPNVEQIAQQFAIPDLTLPFWRFRRKMPAHRIVRLEGEGNYTLFHFADGSQLMVSLTLKKMQSRLPANIFVRLHKKNIINLMYLNEIHPDRFSTGKSQLSVSLLNGDRVDVSRRKANEFIQQVQGFRQELLIKKSTLVAIPTA